MSMIFFYLFKSENQIFKFKFSVALEIYKSVNLSL